MKKIITIASQEVGQNGLNIKDDFVQRPSVYTCDIPLTRRYPLYPLPYRGCTKGID
jgi:hypothetical protein